MTPAKIRRRVHRVLPLALERFELDALCHETYARLAPERAAGRPSADSPGAQALVDYTCRDDRWTARHESLPDQLEEAFAAASALVAAAARAVAPQRPAGRA